MCSFDTITYHDSRVFLFKIISFARRVAQKRTRWFPFFISVFNSNTIEYLYAKFQKIDIITSIARERP